MQTLAVTEAVTTIVVIAQLREIGRYKGQKVIK
jgi:hypothetical protein